MADEEQVENAEKLADLLEKHNKSLEKQKEHLKEIRKFQDKTNAAMKEIIQQVQIGEKENLSLTEERLAKEEIHLQNVKETKKETEKLIQQSERIVKLLEEETEKRIDNETITNEQMNDISAQVSEHKDFIKTLTSEKKELEDQELSSRKRVVLAKSLNKTYENTKQKVAGITTILIGSSKVQETWLGSVMKTANTAGGISTALRGAKEVIVSSIAPANLFANIISKMVQSTAFMVAQTDDALASFNKATGAGGRFNEQIIETGQSNLEFGVGLQESAEAFQALHSEMSLFSQLGKQAQGEAATLTTRLQGIGIAADITAQNLELSTRVLGMTVGQSIAAQEQLAALSEQIGVAPQKLAGDFAAAIPKLAQYGPRATSIFNKLAVQAKATGIELNTLVGIAQQFDTFEGAAQAAGKLNAILGGGLLNSTELLLASEEERIKMLRESIDLSGRNFDSMNKFEKMALANAAGITDMAEASKLFGATSVEFVKMQKEQRTLQERAEASASMMKKLNLIVQAFAVAVEPIIDIIHFFADGFLRLNKFLDGNLAKVLALGTGFLALTGKLGFVSGWVRKLIPGFGGLGSSAGKAAESIGKGLAGGITSVGKAAKTASVPILKLSVAIALAGVGVAVATAGIALLASQMKGMGLEVLALVAVVGILAASMIGFIAVLTLLAPVSAAIAPLLIPISIVMLALGLAIGIAAAGAALLALGFSTIVDSATNLFKVFIDGAPHLSTVASGLLMISGAIAALSFAGLGIVTIASAFGVLTAGVISLAAALSLVSTEELVSLGQMAKALDGMTIEKSVAFQASMEGFEQAVTSIAAVPPATMSNVTEFVQRISEVTALRGAAGLHGAVGSGGAEGPMGAPGLSPGSTTTAATAGNREIVLKLDNRELARAVISVLDDEMKLNLVGQ